MHGYVASARIVRVRPRLAGATCHADQRADAVALDRATLLDDRSAAARAAVAGDGGADDPGLRWTAFRERWSQLTFYLFDPNSWR